MNVCPSKHGGSSSLPAVPFATAASAASRTCGGPGGPEKERTEVTTHQPRGSAGRNQAAANRTRSSGVAGKRSERALRGAACDYGSEVSFRRATPSAVRMRDDDAASHGPAGIHATASAACRGRRPRGRAGGGVSGAWVHGRVDACMGAYGAAWRGLARPGAACPHLTSEQPVQRLRLLPHPLARLTLEVPR